MDKLNLKNVEESLQKVYIDSKSHKLTQYYHRIITFNPCKTESMEAFDISINCTTNEAVRDKILALKEVDFQTQKPRKFSILGAKRDPAVYKLIEDVFTYFREKGIVWEELKIIPPCKKTKSNERYASVPSRAKIAQPPPSESKRRNHLPLPPFLSTFVKSKGT